MPFDEDAFLTFFLFKHLNCLSNSTQVSLFLNLRFCWGPIWAPTALRLPSAQHSTNHSVVSLFVSPWVSLSSDLEIPPSPTLRAGTGSNQAWMEHGKCLMYWIYHRWIKYRARLEVKSSNSKSNVKLETMTSPRVMEAQTNNVQSQVTSLTVFLPQGWSDSVSGGWPGSAL